MAEAALTAVIQEADIQGVPTPPSLQGRNARVQDGLGCAPRSTSA